MASSCSARRFCPGLSSCHLKGVTGAGRGLGLGFADDGGGGGGFLRGEGRGEACPRGAGLPGLLGERRTGGGRWGCGAGVAPEQAPLMHSSAPQYCGVVPQ